MKISFVVSVSCNEGAAFPLGWQYCGMATYLDTHQPH